MGVTEIVLAINIAGVLSIGAISFFITYTTFKGIDDPKIREFSKRYLMLTSFLILTASYLFFYTQYFAAPGSLVALFPFYVLLAITFVLLVYSVMAFEDIAHSYGLDKEGKLSKMEREES